MKAFYSAVVIFGVLLAVAMAAPSESEKQELRKKIILECKESVHATDADINTLKNLEPLTTPTVKCLVACAQKKFGIIVDGKFSVDGLKAAGSRKFEGNDKAIATFNEIADECAEVADADDCELGAKISKCIHDGAIKRNVDVKKYVQY